MCVIKQPIYVYMFRKELYNKLVILVNIVKLYFPPSCCL